MKVQEKIAAVAVFTLGVIWGAYSGDKYTSCEIHQQLEGEVIQVEQIRESNSQYRVHTKSGCTVLVTTSRWLNFLPGDQVKIKGQVELISELPEELAGYASYLGRQGIDGTARFADVSLTQRNTKTTSSLTQNIRQRIERVLQEPEASVVVAMVLADRGMIPDEIVEQFEFSGLSHLLAISGLHISILVGAMLVIGRIIPLSSPVRTGIIILILWTYVSIIGFPVSATRAALFWSFGLIAFQMHALVSITTVFIITITGMVSLSPQIILDVGFQLSFMAVAGIGLALFLTRKTKHTSIQFLIVPISAALVTWPIVSYYFGIVTFGGVFANVLAVPIAPLFLITALLAVSLHTVVPVLGYGLGGVVHGLWGWIFFVAKQVGDAPGSHISYVASPTVIMCWYMFLLGSAMYILKKQKRSWLELWE